VARQVAQCAQAQPFGVGCAHRQRIAVVEAQRNGHAKAQRRQCRIHGLACFGRRTLEDFERNGAGVFGVHIDGTRAQRLVDDGGVAQALPHHGRRCGVRRRRLRQQLGQDVRLREALGTDAQRAFAGLRRCSGAEPGKGEQQQGGAQDAVRQVHRAPVYRDRRASGAPANLLQTLVRATDALKKQTHP
jgi:hypothetical protein